MEIVFGCPRCQHAMQVQGEQAGSRTRCSQCGQPLEVPFPKGQLLDVRPSELGAAPSAVAPAARPHSAAAAAMHPANTPPPANRIAKPLSGSAPGNSTIGQLKADALFKQASACKDEGDFEGAIRHLRDAYDEICRANAMFSVECFVRLPMYLQQVGRPREAWQEFNDLLFQGYPNQTKDVSLVALDRSKIFEKMRLFLETEGKPDIAGVFGVFSRVCKGISLHHEGRSRELRTWFSKSACAEFVHGLKLYNGNLGKLQGIQYAIVGELSEYPNVDYDLLAKRIDVTLRS